MTAIKKRISWKKIFIGIAVFILILFVKILFVLTTDRGTKLFFDHVLSDQEMLSYQYVGGNLWNGIDVQKLNIKLDQTKISADSAKVHLGWRAILAKEAHFMQSDIKNLQIITAPSDGKPFSYPELKLPLTLRFNQLNVDQLTIKTLNSETKISNIQLNDAVWNDTELSFEDSRLDLYDIFIDQATGKIDFKNTYPLELDAQVKIPAIENSLNIKNIFAKANGSLQRINLGVATQTPDLLTGWAVIQPMDDLVPMKGQLQFKQYHFPFLTDQKFFADNGTLDFSGTYQGFDLMLNGQLSGVDIPKGQYIGKMYTDFVKGLDVHYLTADIYDGQVEIKGRLDWQDTDNIKWHSTGYFDDLKLPQALISNEVQEFLPKNMSGEIQSRGVLNKGVQTQNMIRFSNKEEWTFSYNNDNLQQTQQPHILDVTWKNIHREMPYIVGLNSKNGQARVHLEDKRQIVDVNVDVEKYPESFIPTGNYQAKLLMQGDELHVNDLLYTQEDSQVKGSVSVQLPTNKQPLNWLAKLNLQRFNPQMVQESLPMNALSGYIEINGYAKNDTTQIIHTKNMDLTGSLENAYVSKEINAEQINLKGNSTTALLFDKNDGAFKSFAVQYDGTLRGLHQKDDGALQFKIAGTPSFMNIEHLYHNGVAGQLDAQGYVDLSQGVKWDVKTQLKNFKPQYFHSAVEGDITGIIKMNGEWSERRKLIGLDQFDITGTLNQQKISGNGQLSVDLSQLDKGLAQQKFSANQLNLVYADNKIQVAGDQNNLQMQIDAMHLHQVLPGLVGNVSGRLTVQKDKRLQVYSNILADQLKYKDLFEVKSLRLLGELPVSEQMPSELLLKIEGLSAFGRDIDKAQVNLTGTYLTHLLKIESNQPKSAFSLQIAGGFDKNRWLGQLQQGRFISPKMQLIQNRNADIVYLLDKKHLTIAQHCWNNKQNQICFDEDIIASPTQASVSVITKNIHLQDLGEFIPQGMELTGQLNGYAKASWNKGNSPKIEAELITRNGLVGLLSEVENEKASLKYDELSTIIQTTKNGILLHTNVKTPDIGTGFARVLIDPEIKDYPIKGEVAFDKVQLQVLRPFINDVRQMSGSLSIAGKIDGYLLKPNFMGEARLKDGAFSLSSLPVDLRNIDMYMAIRQNKAQLNGLFHSGKGQASITGQMAWTQQPYLRFKVKGEDLLVRQAPQIMASINPDLNIEILPTKQQISVDGQVLIPRALINMPENRASAVEVSPDVRVVRLNKNQLDTLESARDWDIRTNINVTLGNQIIFQGFDARIPMGGKLVLLQNGKELALRAKGAIGITQKVPISAYGQTIDLSRAIARFDGPLVNPHLDIDAIKSIQGSNVGVRVLGTALNPDVQIYSDAGLSEQEALNALLTGRISEGSGVETTTESFRSDVNNAVAAAGISMGLGGTRALTNQIGQVFGLSGLALDAQGVGNDTQVSLTGYITPDLYIRYGVGVFTPINRLTLRYQINRRLYLEASQDLERAIDLFYNWRF